MNVKHICFFNAQETSFVVKLDQQSFCFYDNRKNESNKIQFLADAYSKIYPSKLTLIPLHAKKQTNVTVNPKNSIKITRIKGGYSIQINEKSYFLALSDFEENVEGEIIYASWLPKNNTRNHLGNGAVVFGIE